jgi:hypothetical protein
VAVAVIPAIMRLNPVGSQGACRMRQQFPLH